MQTNFSTREAMRVVQQALAPRVAMADRSFIDRVTPWILADLREVLRRIEMVRGNPGINALARQAERIVDSPAKPTGLSSHFSAYQFMLNAANTAHGLLDVVDTLSGRAPGEN